MTEKQSCTSNIDTCWRGSRDAGLLVGARRGGARGREVRAVPLVELHLLAVGHRELQGLHAHEILLAQAARDVGRGDDRRRRAVRHAAAIVQTERVGDHRRLEHGLLGDAVAQVRLRVLRAVVVALHRDMRHRALEVFLVDAVLGAVGRGELRERARRRDVGPGHVLQRAATALRQAAVAGVLELLDAERERDVDRAGGDRVHRTAERLGAGRAVVLHARDRDVRQAQRHGERHARLADVLLLDRRAEPRRLDLLALDARVLQRLLEGVDHQVLGVLVPVLAELRAPHAEDHDLVFNACRHCLPPRGQTPVDNFGSYPFS